MTWPDGVNIDAAAVQVTSKDAVNIGYVGGGLGGTPVENGVITGSIDQMFMDGARNADEYPDIDLSVDIPVDGTNAMLISTPAPGQSSGEQVNLSLPMIGTFHFEFNIPVYKGIKIENIDQTVSASNISMTMRV